MRRSHRVSSRKLLYLLARVFDIDKSTSFTPKCLSPLPFLCCHLILKNSIVYQTFFRIFKPHTYKRKQQMVSFLLTFLFVRDDFPSGFCSMQSEMPVLVYCRSLKLNIRTPKPIPKTQPTITGMEPIKKKTALVTTSKASKESKMMKTHLR